MNQVKVYRVQKFTYQPFDNWIPVVIYILQCQLDNGDWYTLNASDKNADIKHACYEGLHQDEKSAAYKKFMSGD